MITAVAEAYPELKSNENYKTLMNELSMTENMIAEYRSNYNKQIKEYKRYVRKFPTRQFLGLLGYEVQEYYYLDNRWLDQQEIFLSFGQIGGIICLLQQTLVQ